MYFSLYFLLSFLLTFPIPFFLSVFLTSPPLPAPKDYLLFSNRSQIHASLRRYDMALSDAETACTLMPHWSKVRAAMDCMAFNWPSGTMIHVYPQQAVD